MTADVSVIMPAYRAAKTIARAIKSVANQTRPPKEIIVCDDGSDDGTADIVRALGAQINGVALQLLVQQNKGAGAARNHAIRHASGQLLAFLDADDEWLAEKLEKSLSVLRSENHTLVAHDFVQINEGAPDQIIECARRFLASDNAYQDFYRYGFIGTSTVVVDRSAVIEAGSFDESLATAQDFDLWLKILKREKATFTIFEAPLMRYTVNPTGITSFTARRLQCSLRVAQRHQPNLLSLCFRILAVHFEAFNRYRQTAQWGRALVVCLALPGRLIAAPLSTGDAEITPSPTPEWVVTMIWVWVIAAFAAYLYRFSHLIEAFFKLVLSL